MKLIEKIPLQIILFAFFFGILASFINSNDIKIFPIYHLGIEAIVERGNIHLQGSETFQSAPGLGSDQFEFKGRIYTNKQPGIFFIGSIVYYLLKVFGITYKNNFMLAAGLVILFTSVLMSAVMITLIFNIAFNITKNYFYSLLISCFFGFGTLVFPYSGLVHHDISATFFLFLGFYLLFYKYHMSKKNILFIIPLSGFCIGFSLFNSYNILALMLFLSLYVILHKNLKDIILFLIFLICGLLPSFIFNYVVFGDPLLFPIKLFNFDERSEFYYQFDIPSRLYFYFISPKTSITFFSPITIMGLVGIFLLPSKYSREKATIVSAFLLETINLSTQTYVGWCQYGPRYFLEIFPFVLIGLSSFFTEHKKFIPFVFLLGVISIIICTTGSLMGCIYCDTDKNAFLSYVTKIISGELPDFQFAYFGIFMVLVSASLLFLKFPEDTLLKFWKKQFN